MSGVKAADEGFCDLEVCLEELLVNVFSYGYEKVERKPEVNVCVSRGSEGFIIEIIDNAAPFNPLTQSYEPILAANLESRRIGGLGIRLVKNLSDKFSYYPMESGNRIVLHKRVEAID